MSSVPPLRPFATGAVPLPTGAEAAAFDRQAIGERGVPESALMESAGRAAAAVVRRLYPRGEVVGLVGDGNNGGDALVVLRTLAAWGRPVRAVLVGERAAQDPLLHGWSVPIERDSALGDAALAHRLAGAGVIVDGMLGTGLTGEPRERHARVIGALRDVAAPVVALDVPSGVDADGGAVPGAAVTADVTVAFGWPKLGTLLHPARAHTGRLIAVEIGFPPVEGDAWPGWLLTPAWAAGVRPDRGPDTHKNEVGSLLLVAGCFGMAGAAVLAGRAALRAGVGYVRLASVPANREILQEAVPDAPFVDATDHAALAEAAEASAAVAAGPGLGTGSESEAVLARLLEAAGDRLVLDADALNLLAEGRPTTLAAAAGARGVVATPHPGEMARLSGRAVADIQSDRPGAARALAADAGCTVVLKGMPSLVATPDGRLAVAGLGGSELAAAGMGDVLTGVIGSLLAQGLGPADAAGLALVTTARAAARVAFGAGLAASDVPDEVPAALAELGPGATDLDEPWVLLDLDEAH
jgi:NAD(P)H-hydrate epimerase